MRKAVLGPVQQGGTPSPIDRIQAVQLAYFSVRSLLEAIAIGINGGYFVGCEKGEVVMHDWKQLRNYPDPWQRTNVKRWWHDYEEAIHRLSINPQVRKMMDQQ